MAPGRCYWDVHIGEFCAQYLRYALGSDAISMSASTISSTSCCSEVFCGFQPSLVRALDGSPSSSSTWQHSAPVQFPHRGNY
jgi:hypothetical protein